MLIIDLPGRGRLELEYLVLDMNGTLAVDGTALPGVAERVDLLRAVLVPVVLTADTHGGSARLGVDLGVEVVRLDSLNDSAAVTRPPAGGTAQGAPGSDRRGRTDEGVAKAAYVEGLGPDRVVAVGNGANDEAMLEAAAVGICVVGLEGAAVRTLTAADVAVGDICAALDLLLHPRRLVATLRR